MVLERPVVLEHGHTGGRPAGRALYLSPAYDSDDAR
jgi:hypothetical protein